MEIKEMRESVDEWIQQHKITYWKPLEILARLTEEVGELARELNNTYGPRVKKSSEDKKDTEDEVADILFTLMCLTNSLDLDIESAFKRNMDKLYNRDKDRYEKK